LENGLTVLLRPVPAAEQVAVMTLYSIGNDHDPEDKSGLAHLIEHLYVCDATGDTGPRTVEQFMKAYPAGWNAYTGDDFTLYATVGPRERLFAELKDTAARMTGLQVTAEVVEREKARLIAEVSNMFGGYPDLAAFNLARQQVRPGRRDARRGGVPEQVKTITLEEIRERLDQFYKPRNAMLIIAGGFDADETQTVIKDLLGTVPHGKAVPRPGPPEPPRLGQTITIAIEPTSPGSLPQVCIAYPAPLPLEKDYVPFLIVANRLMQAMADGKGAKRYEMHYAPLDDPAVLALRTVLKDEETTEDAIRRLSSAVDDACHAAVNKSEREKVRYGLGAFLGLGDMPDAVWAKNPYGLALAIGRRHQLGVEAEALRRSLAKTSTEDLGKAAEKYFIPRMRATVIVRKHEDESSH
jgi:zinc protease